MARKYWQAVVSLVAFLPLAPAGAAEPTPDELLAAGRYADIKAPGKDDVHGHAVWAFAQFHLAPRDAVAKAAQLAHAQGDDLGTFVLMLCHRSGAGLLRDREEALALNFDLRMRLETKTKPTPLQLYMLSQCQAGDRTGRTLNKDAEKLFAEINRQRQLAAERLEKAAKLGLAQAEQEWALAQEEPGEAHAWHQKASDLGLAEGMRYAGLQLVLGRGAKKDAAKGILLSEKAAEKGDVYAMVNLAVFHDRGLGVEKDAAHAQRWLDAADKTGHWYGGIERGMSLLTGDYGTKADPVRGAAVLQKAVATGHGDALAFVATAYAKGVGLKQDGKQALAFAEAAYRQGGSSAAGVLAFVYSEGAPGVEPNEDQAEFWGREARKPGFGIQLLEEKARAEFFRRINGIDPSKLKVE